jgi:hypothetical protein
VKEAIHQIGESLIQCTAGCTDVHFDQSTYRQPRCLIYESDGRNQPEPGCVVIGLNPGRTSRKEIEHYKNKGLSYNSFLTWWQKGDRTRFNGYYGKMKSFVDGYGIKGPILWTELAKCDCAQGVGALSVQTLRTCSEKYLKQEIEKVPDNWTIIAVSKKAFEASCFLFPNRTVIGVAHPTGSYGQFVGLFDSDRNLLYKYQQHNHQKGTVYWLSASRSRSSEF